MTRRIFVDIDTQNDLVSEGGACPFPVTSEQSFKIKKLVAHACIEHNLVVGSVMSHDYSSWKFNTNTRKGPNQENPRQRPFCVKGTYGWLKNTETLPEKSVFVPNVARYTNWYPDVQGIYFEREEGDSLFSNRNVVGCLYDFVAKAYNNTATKEPVEFVLFGLGLETTIKNTAIDLMDWCENTVLHDRGGTLKQALEEGFVVKVVEDASVAREEQTIETTKKELTELGIKIVNSEEFLGEVSKFKPKKIKNGSNILFG